MQFKVPVFLAATLLGAANAAPAEPTPTGSTPMNPKEMPGLSSIMENNESFALKMISADKRFNGKFFVPTARAGGVAFGNTTETASYEFRLDKARKMGAGRFNGVYFGELTFKKEFRLIGAGAPHQEVSKTREGTPLVQPMMFFKDENKIPERLRNRPRSSAIGPRGILRPYHATIACMASEGAVVSKVGELDGPVKPGTKHNEGCAPVRLRVEPAPSKSKSD